MNKTIPAYDFLFGVYKQADSKPKQLIDLD